MMKQVRKLIAVLVACQIPSGFAEWQLNLSPAATEIGRDIHSLHMTIFYICVVIAVLVFGIMFYSIAKHRKSLGAEAKPFHESTLVEIIWTAIPLLILVAMAVPATKTLMAMYDTETSDIDIKVVGYQWKWSYEYLSNNPDEQIKFFSVLTTSNDAQRDKAEKSENYLLEVDNPLVIPVGKKVRFLFTAQDVIHSWWVPELAVKKDAIPGFINEAWTRVDKPGTYRGQCAELCGQGHGYMPIVVEAVSQQDYDNWLKQQQTNMAAQSTLSELSNEELMTQGKAGYEKHCAACHQVSGAGIPPVFPSLIGSKITTEDLNEHIRIVLYGKSGTAMAGFGEQLSFTELAAIISYERNAWGNDTGEFIQAKDVKAFIDNQNKGGQQ